MKRALSSLAAAALLTALLSAPAQAAFGLHGLKLAFEEEDATPVALAGSHPFAMQNQMAVDTIEDPVLKFQVPSEDFKDLRIDTPAGLVADRNATPQCTTAEFRPAGGGEPECARASTVGVADVELGNPGTFYHTPVYNLTPPPGAVAKLGLMPLGVPVTVEAGLSQEAPYHGVAKLSNTLQVYGFYSAKLTLWGVPAASAHDAQRGGPVDGAKRPFLTMPRSCTGPLSTTFTATSWQGGSFAQRIETQGIGSEALGMGGCQDLGFSANVSAQPTDRSAEGPSGLDFGLDVANPELTNPTGRANSDIKEVIATLPKGVTINPSQAEGLGVCSEKNLEAETLGSAPGTGCPQSSKIGTVEVESPLAEGEIIKGALYVAKPYENLADDSLIAFYFVLKDPQLGILVTQAAKVQPDPATGQLITTTKDMPQLPFSHFRLHFREGARSPLITPPTCGTYTTEVQFHTWANPAATYPATSTFTIDSGVGGGPCPTAAKPPFDPGFEAGTQASDGGEYSPFDLRLTRRDGDQDLTRFSFTLPPGAAAKLAGVEQCSDGAIATAKAKSGKAELAHPSCPPNSKIGDVLAGAGVGSQLTYVAGKAYLAGPYNGDPLSVVAIVPALAGPFDVGTVITRVALTVDPKSAVAIVDGSRSDPIPHILAGIPLKVREVRVSTNRPQFTFNPTDCDPFAVGAELWGGGADPFSSADDSPVSRQAPFQASNCARLGFAPKLAISLKGGIRRGAHPALKAVVTPRAGDANFAAAVVTLPRSAFLDQGHIRTVCTRVQFAAKACPPGSIYGFASAYTPILDAPATGPVYLRSSDHKLPDLVIALHGPPSAPLDVELSARIDSHKGGIRTSFEAIPDLPVSRFVLEMRGGERGLIVNSRNLCANPSRATARLRAQNNRRFSSEPLVGAAGCRAGGGRSRR